MILTNSSRRAGICLTAQADLLTGKKVETAAQRAANADRREKFKRK
jgi:hypothetical protein